MRLRQHTGSANRKSKAVHTLRKQTTARTATLIQQHNSHTAMQHWRQICTCHAAVFDRDAFAFICEHTRGTALIPLDHTSTSPTGRTTLAAGKACSAMQPIDMRVHARMCSLAALRHKLSDCCKPALAACGAAADDTARAGAVYTEIKRLALPP
jgi:hypothetical protein